ncbi:hypothetical protein SJI00_21165 [Pseudomonas sp. RP23018S]|uniref:hypothetical protein n=1 Tax=Pseudomonas sp. RP23018S TaxID=3096037 RepID=UPI002ACAD18B|nr:hypothetical protein [Pseudomonas sp. RP23018S]MDZ5605288.1 hypothetical protein [Pseudomonas sp. RP23018S]
MIVIDAERALRAEKKMLADAEARMDSQSSPIKETPDAVGKESPAVGVDDPAQPQVPPFNMEVLGIFGLGNSLMADVSINGSQVRYKRGQTQPVGSASGFPFQLVRIKLPCVKVVDASKTEHEACMTNKFK